MKNQNEMMETTTYEAPQVKTVEVRVEKGFAASDPTITNPDMGWG